MSVDAAVSNHGLRRRREPAGVRAGICSLDQGKNGNEKNKKSTRTHFVSKEERGRMKLMYRSEM